MFHEDMTSHYYDSYIKNILVQKIYDTILFIGLKISVIFKLLLFDEKVLNLQDYRFDIILLLLVRIS